MDSPNNFKVDSSLSSFNVPLHEFRKQHDGLRLVVGSAIKSTDNRVLILQRSATEHMLPNVFELPGGKAEEDDATIFHAVVRETLEETGLIVSGILSAFGGFEYETKSGKRAHQFNFLVYVEDSSSVRLNPEEHQKYAWISKDDDLSQYLMTEEMKETVVRALALL